jgi:hypothetical protein
VIPSAQAIFFSVGASARTSMTKRAGLFKLETCNLYEK